MLTQFGEFLSGWFRYNTGIPNVENKNITSKKQAMTALNMAPEDENPERPRSPVPPEPMWKRLEDTGRMILANKQSPPNNRKAAKLFIKLAALERAQGS
jgi:hypothetical protein